MAEASISVYLDTRRKKEGGVYPIKIRVYHDYETRFYPIGVDVSKEDFERAYLSKKPRQEYKELRGKIIANEVRVRTIAEELRTFDFTRFEKLLLRATGAGTNVFYHYRQTITKLNKDGQIGTASNYDLSAKSLLHFLFSQGKLKDASLALTNKKEYGTGLIDILDFLKGKGIKLELGFDEVTISFLNNYERWMIKEGNSITTVGIYLRPLRAIFNTAITEGEIEKESYPFGKKKYQIPKGRNIKKSLTKEELKRLFEYPLTNNPYMAKARAFWFFSYATNGLNIKDIALLQYSNIIGDSVTFIRAKTKNTAKTDLKPIVAVLTPFAQQVIREYGNPKISPATYVFPTLQPGMSEVEKHRRIKAFAKFINQHMKNLAKLVGVNEDISNMYARHSFTTVSVQNGASLEFIQDSLGHTSISTTMNYWAGFSENVKRDNANKLMDF